MHICWYPLSYRTPRVPTHVGTSYGYPPPSSLQPNEHHDTEVSEYINHISGQCRPWGRPGHINHLHLRRAKRTKSGGFPFITQPPQSWASPTSHRRLSVKFLLSIQPSACSAVFASFLQNGAHKDVTYPYQEIFPRTPFIQHALSPSLSSKLSCPQHRRSWNPCLLSLFWCGRHHRSSIRTLRYSHPSPTRSPQWGM